MFKTGDLVRVKDQRLWCKNMIGQVSSLYPHSSDGNGTLMLFIEFDTNKDKITSLGQWVHSSRLELVFST